MKKITALIGALLVSIGFNIYFKLNINLLEKASVHMNNSAQNQVFSAVAIYNGSSAPSSNGSLNGVHKNVNEHPGRRYWQKVKDDLWIEIYPEYDQFSLFRKIKTETIDNIEGDLLEPLVLNMKGNNDKLYSYATSNEHQDRYFIPQKIASVKLLHKTDGTAQWQSVFELQAIK